jgi:phosphoglycerol transferase MdoB-like AlkP superfamily enzyme
MLGIFALQRWALWVAHQPLQGVGAKFFETSIQGFLMDLAIVSVLTIPWCAVVFFEWRKRWMFYAILFGWMFIFTFLNVCDFLFFDEFNSRFNYIAIDYLFLNTAEVLANIQQSYPVAPIVSGIAVFVGILLWGFRKFLNRSFAVQASLRQGFVAISGTSLVAIALAFPVDIRSIHSNPNRIQGEIGANGFYTLFYALKTSHLVYDRYYRSLPDGEAFERAKRLIYHRGDRELNVLENPLLRRIPARKGLGRKNVILILEESFGSAFVGALRRPPEDLTPAFDRLASEGILFTRVYATGTRTVRGLEAVLSSFPPIPGASIVKRRGFGQVDTLATVFKTQGYDTAFIYGGRGIFDNMRGFALGNGFDRFIEQKDYAYPVFTTAWGVSDEDIFNQVLEDAGRQAANGKPFFTTVLTVSNHKPYTYPKDRIDLNPDDQRRPHAVKYADWALGKFFERAKSLPFYKDTVFVVAGDHGARVYGADFIPLPSYEVPVLIYAPHLLGKAKRIDQLASSMDVAPTLLGLLGFAYDSTFYGRDLLREDPREPYVLLQHDRDIARLRGSRLTLLSTGMQAYAFDLDSSSSSFGRSAPSEEEIRDTAALYQSAFRLFENGRYHAGDR